MVVLGRTKKYLVLRRIDVQRAKLSHVCREKAEELAGRLGDKFLDGYKRKYTEIMYGTEGAE